MSSDACATRQGFSSFRTFLRVCGMHHFTLCGTAPGILGGGKPEKFLGPVEFRGGGEFHGAAPPTGGPGPLGGVAAKATACEDISYYNEKMLSQQTCLLAYRKTPPQHF